MNRAGFVYVIQCGNSDLYKIGCTASKPMKRMRSLQTGSPHQLVMHEVFFTLDREQTERDAHQKWRSKRVRGEWFKLSAWDIDQLTTYLSNDELYLYYTIQDQQAAKDKDLHRVSSRLADHDYNEILPNEVEDASPHVTESRISARYAGVQQNEGHK